MERERDNLGPCENLDDYEYELIGVIIHQGTADSGHYYSFIRNRREDGLLDPEKWC